MNELAEESEETADLHALFSTLASRRWWIVGSIVLSTVIFGAIALLALPTYRAVAVLAPANGDRGADVLGLAASQLGGLASAAGLSLGPKDLDTEEALAVLQSREFTEAFIAEKKLMPKLFPSKWNPTTGAWKVDHDHEPTLGKAFKYFDRKVRLLTRDRKTGLITLQIDWTDRYEAAEWANELVRLLNQEMRERAIAKTDAALRFLEKELQTTSTMEARNAISRLIEAQVKYRMLADVTPDYSLRVVDKAIASDRDDPVKPQKLLLFVLGPTLGLALGIVFVLLVAPRSPRAADD